jgi:CheY-like chemotaxis protein
MDIFNKILIIDDDPIHNMVSSKLIEKAKFSNKTDKVLSGKLELEYLSRNAKENSLPDLIFLDINMPLMDGWEFLKHYEEFRKENAVDIHILMLTSSISPEDIEKSKNHPLVFEFVTKPLSIDKLNDIRNSLMVA